MCGRKSRACLLGLALLLLSSAASSQPLSYDGPALPEGWVPVHLLELDEWQAILTEQRIISATLRTQLATLDAQLMTASTQLIASTAALTEARASLTAYARERDAQVRALQTELWVTRGGLALLAALTIWSLIR